MTWREPCWQLFTVNHRLLLICLAAGSVVVGCSNNGNPGISPHTQPDADATASDTDAGGNDGAAPAETGSGSDAPTGQATDDSPASASCPVLAKNYDQSCTVDSDCIGVDQTLSCPANGCAFCGTGTINRKAAAQYQADFSHVTAAVPRDADACNCPMGADYPCCRAGVCHQCVDAMTPDGAAVIPLGY